MWGSRESDDGSGKGRFLSISEIELILDLGFDPNDWIRYLLRLEASLVTVASEELRA